MPSRQELATPSSASAPSKKKPKKITGPPPRSRPFKRPYHLSKDHPMSWYRSDANNLFLRPIFRGPCPLSECLKLPKLLERPIRHNDEPIAVNGFDATKRHFYATQARWERAVEIVAEEGRRMVYYRKTMRKEAQACHKWVGQVGKMTWDGHHGRMKNYDAFQEALDEVQKLIKQAEEMIREVQEPTKKWPVEFICQRRAWGEEEEDPTDDDEEDEDEAVFSLFRL